MFLVSLEFELCDYFGLISLVDVAFAAALDNQEKKNFRAAKCPNQVKRCMHAAIKDDLGYMRGLMEEVRRQFTAEVDVISPHFRLCCFNVRCDATNGNVWQKQKLHACEVVCSYLDTGALLEDCGDSMGLVLVGLQWAEGHEVCFALIEIMHPGGKALPYAPQQETSALCFFSSSWEEVAQGFTCGWWTRCSRSHKCFADLLPVVDGSGKVWSS